MLYFQLLCMYTTFVHNCSQLHRQSTSSAYFPNVGLCNFRPVCMSVYAFPPSTVECLNQSLWNLVCIHGNWAHLNGILHKSCPTVCVSVCISLLLLLGKGLVKCIHPSVARQWLGKHIPVVMNTHTNRRTVKHVIFYVIHVFSKEGLWVCVFHCCC
jgi:hypothetical protein